MLWSQVHGPKILEVGVGIGKDIPYYPSSMQITGIGLTPGMLNRARIRAANLNQYTELRLGDVQRLKFYDGSFDSAIANYVF